MAFGVIFDMDGVLVASGPAHQASWRMVAKKHCISVSDDQFRTLFGRTSRDIIGELWGFALSEVEAHRIDEEKEAAYRELITGMVPLMIGCREVLADLRAAGHQLAIATSGPRENVSLVLRETGLKEQFHAVVTGFDVVHGKPAPDCFLLAAERLGLTPSHCVVVEDAPAGIAAALAGKMPVIALVGTHPADRLHSAGATCVVNRLAEITPQLVESLIGR